MLKFTYNGIDSSELGIYFASVPEFAAPSPVYTDTKVTGRNGVVSYWDGSYENVNGNFNLVQLGENLDETILKTVSSDSAAIVTGETANREVYNINAVDGEVNLFNSNLYIGYNMSGTAASGTIIGKFSDGIQTVSSDGASVSAIICTTTSKHVGTANCNCLFKSPIDATIYFHSNPSVDTNKKVYYQIYSDVASGAQYEYGDGIAISVTAGETIGFRAYVRSGWSGYVEFRPQLYVVPDKPDWEEGKQITISSGSISAVESIGPDVNIVANGGFSAELMPRSVYAASLFEISPSYKRLEVSSEPNVFRLAKIKSGLKTKMKYGTYNASSIVFDCMPQKFLKSGEESIIISGQTTLINHYFNSKPKIVVRGSGAGTITVGSITATISTITDGMIIDSELMDCYKGNQNLNASVTFPDFPTLKHGANVISFTGGVAGLEITPRWWTL